MHGDGGTRCCLTPAQVVASAAAAAAPALASVTHTCCPLASLVESHSAYLQQKIGRLLCPRGSPPPSRTSLRPPFGAHQLVLCLCYYCCSASLTSLNKPACFLPLCCCEAPPSSSLHWKGKRRPGILTTIPTLPELTVWCIGKTSPSLMYPPLPRMLLCCALLCTATQQPAPWLFFGDCPQRSQSAA